MNTVVTARAACLLFAFTYNTNNTMEYEELQRAIVENYLHGAFNETNIDAFTAIFHPEFSIISLQNDGRFFHFTRDAWESVLRQRLANTNFDASTIAFTPEFRSIDIVGKKASVTLDLLLDGKTVYTDFLLLVQHDNQWQIVSKIYHEH